MLALISALGSCQQTHPRTAITQPREGLPQRHALAGRSWLCPPDRSRAGGFPSVRAPKALPSRGVTSVSICFHWKPPLMLPHETEWGDTKKTSPRCIWCSWKAASFLSVLPTPASPLPLQHSSDAQSSKTHVQCVNPMGLVYSLDI